jgi:hypothetical protein
VLLCINRMRLRGLQCDWASFENCFHLCILVECPWPGGVLGAGDSEGEGTRGGNAQGMHGLKIQRKISGIFLKSVRLRGGYLADEEFSYGGAQHSAAVAASGWGGGGVGGGERGMGLCLSV